MLTKTAKGVLASATIALIALTVSTGAVATPPVKADGTQTKADDIQAKADGTEGPGKPSTVLNFKPKISAGGCSSIVGKKYHEIRWDIPLNGYGVQMVIERYNFHTGQTNGTPKRFNSPQNTSARTVSNVRNSTDRWRVYFVGYASSGPQSGQWVRSDYATFYSVDTSYGKCETRVLSSGSGRGEWPVAPPAHAVTSPRVGQTISMTNAWSHKAPDAEGYVKQKFPSDSNFQKWRLEDAGNGSFFLRNVQRNACLAAHARQGRDVFVYPCGNAPDQKWRFEPKTAGTHRIVNGLGQHLDVPNSAVTDSPLITWGDFYNEANQYWWVTDAS
ncbi:RICIN domain-containing protein [Streptomyces pathocidini]|uniref:RICIN domain-containing protein n=1 Tax=Streptomyces pathocidini TaxID=1650571 RepID=A0ABW7USW2_9ACTN|nr:RICIN domain-containing protein [Streptomyces pathocidini]